MGSAVFEGQRGRGVLLSGPGVDLRPRHHQGHSSNGTPNTECHALTRTRRGETPQRDERAFIALQVPIAAHDRSSSATERPAGGSSGCGHRQRRSARLGRRRGLSMPSGSYRQVRARATRSSTRCHTARQERFLDKPAADVRHGLRIVRGPPRAAAGRRLNGSVPASGGAG